MIKKCSLMVQAVILINTEAGAEELVLEQLKTVSSVREACIIYSCYDIVCKIAEFDMGMLKDILTERIRKIKSVRSTLTMVITKN